MNNRDTDMVRLSVGGQVFSRKEDTQMRENNCIAENAKPTPSRRLTHSKKRSFSWKSTAEAISVVLDLIKVGYYGTLLWTLIQNFI
jgi:hypothetical protein